MKIFKRILIVIFSIILILVIGVLLASKFYKTPLSEKYGHVDTQLFVGDSSKQPLVVAFGGSQGGNTWTEEYWGEKRDMLLKNGYAVLSVGYFNTNNTPESLDRISINAIYDSIKNAAAHPKINNDKIVLLGSSRGGELVLNLASRYKDIDAVIAMVPSHVTFGALTLLGNTSAWTFNDIEIDPIKVPFKAFVSSLKGDKKKTMKLIFEHDDNSIKPIIKVEKINGPILLLSAKHDELWPSNYMSDQIVNRLKEKEFKYYYEHFAFNGSHYDTKKHFDVVLKFLDDHIKEN